MKKGFKNFILVTLVVTLVAIFIITLIDYLIGPIVLLAAVSVVLWSIYVIYMHIRAVQQKKLADKLEDLRLNPHKKNRYKKKVKNYNGILMRFFV
jgi:Flp pilus assembly protein TadB